MTTLEARKAILADLEAGGFLKETEPLKHEVGTCYRCHSTIEPMVSKQWFVKMEPLAKPAIESVEKGDIKFVPERFTKNYMNWMKNTRDWCISRQLWWGHQIPAWYCDDCGETVVAKSAPCSCPKCGGTKLTQDPDTLDTWFSSALWPFSTLGWPNEESADLKYFYPTNTLVTGYDIIGFWVSRMIFSGLAYTGKAPFDTVCIHGIVRDSQGRKMSKSLGNGIDPLEVIAKYGADALRFMLVDGSTPGNDMRYSEKKVEAARNFANKLWNATRFVLMNLPEDFQPGLPEESKLDMSDKWVLTKLNQVAGAMSDNLDHYEMGLAAAKINSFIWDVYCDWFIEIAKPRLNSGDAEQADTARRVLVYVLDKALKLLHPFMPFITEELYQALPGSAETIMTQPWPTVDESHNWTAEEEAFEKVMDYIKAVRTMRTEMNVHPAKKTSMIIETADAAPFQSAQVYLAKFAFATDVTFTAKYEGGTDGMVQVSTHAARGFIPMMELIDREKELARLNKERPRRKKSWPCLRTSSTTPSSSSVPRRLWWKRSAISTPRARISWPTSSRASRLWAEHVRTEPALFSLAHRRAGDLYAGAHRLHRVHLLQLHADRRGVGGGQRPCASLGTAGAHPAGDARPCIPHHHAFHPQAGTFLRVCPGGFPAHALPAGVHPAFCPAHVLAHSGWFAHGPDG